MTENEQSKPVEESGAQNVLPFPNVAVPKTYSMTMKHISMITEMADFESCSEAKILREAVDLLYATKFPKSV